MDTASLSKALSSASSCPSLQSTGNCRDLRAACCSSGYLTWSLGSRHHSAHMVAHVLRHLLKTKEDCSVLKSCSFSWEWPPPHSNCCSLEPTPSCPLLYLVVAQEAIPKHQVAASIPPSHSTVHDGTTGSSVSASTSLVSVSESFLSATTSICVSTPTFYSASTSLASFSENPQSFSGTDSCLPANPVSSPQLPSQSSHSPDGLQLLDSTTRKRARPPSSSTCSYASSVSVPALPSSNSNSSWSSSEVSTGPLKEASGVVPTSNLPQIPRSLPSLDLRVGGHSNTQDSVRGVPDSSRKCVRDGQPRSPCFLKNSRQRFKKRLQKIARNLLCCCT